MWVFSGEKKKLHCFASFGNAEVVRITETDSGFIEINSLPKQIKWKKAAKEYQASAEAIQMAHHIEKHVHCLLFDLFLCWVCVFIFFQVAVTFTCEYGVVKTPTHTKQNQTSCIQNMRCTYVKNTIVCTVKCRCINCGYGKLSVQSVKRIKREPPLLTTSLSSQTSLESCLTQEKKESDRG